MKRTFSIDEETTQRLLELAAHYETSESAAVRVAVREMHERMTKTAKWLWGQHQAEKPERKAKL